ncbi:hypothetical protein JOQ06_018020, partial [Pogonophryne albipinna]
PNPVVLKTGMMLHRVAETVCREIGEARAFEASANTELICHQPTAPKELLFCPEDYQRLTPFNQSTILRNVEAVLLASVDLCSSAEVLLPTRQIPRTLQRVPLQLMRTPSELRLH